VARDDLKLLEPVATLGRGRIRANMPLSRQRRRETSEAVTGAKSYDENVEECGHFLIQPDPGPSVSRSWSGGPPTAGSPSQAGRR
jgi:hypothetical protein